MNSSNRTNNQPSPRMLFKKNILAMCIMALSTQTFAQTVTKTNTTNTPDQNLEEVVVTGFRPNLQNAQEIKRNAATFVDAISAEDIGSLPDKSVTESLQRVPGVALERYAAALDPDHFSIEGSGITLRGLPQTRSEFNGRDSFSANSGRGLSFQDVPPELMAKVEVFKNQSADMIEGGISGTVNLTTRKPFDSAKQIIAFTAIEDYADLSKETQPSFSGLYSNQWDTASGNYGLLISLADSKLTTRTDGVREGRLPRDANGTPMQSDVVVDGQTVKRWLPLNAGLSSTIQERERKGASLVAQWSNPADNLEATFEYLRSDATQDWTEHTLSNDDNPGTPSADSTYNDTNFTSGTLLNVDNYDATTRRSHRVSLVEDYSLHLKYTPTEELTISGDAQYVKSNTQAFDVSFFAGIKASSKMDFRSNSPSVMAIAPTDTATPENYFLDPANYYYKAAMDHLEDNDGDESAYRLDAKYELNEGWVKSVETGIRFSDRDQTTRFSKYNWGVLSETWAASNGRKYFDGIYDNTPWDGQHNGGSYDVPGYQTTAPDNFFRSKNSGVRGRSFLVPSEALVKDYASFVAAVKPFGFVDIASRGTGTSVYLDNEINGITESNEAIYAKLNFGNDSDTLMGNLGLRYVHVENEAIGALTYSTPISADIQPLLPADDIIFSDGKQGAKNTVNNSTNKLLPSFNIKYLFSDELQGRFAVSKAISFPDLGNIRNYTSIYPVLNVVSVNGVAQSATIEYNANAGNPHLKPMESINYDASVEWYFAKGSSVFAGVFYKDLSNFFANAAVPTSFTNNGVTRTVNVDQAINQGNSVVTGLEFGYQQFYDMLPAPFDGFGSQFNITLLDQSGTVPNSGLDLGNPPDKTPGLGAKPIFKVPLQGLSDTTYNIVGMYEKGAVSVRVAYNWRSEYLLTTRDVITRLPIYSMPSGQMDASIAYQINDNFKIALEGSNLLNEMTHTSMQVDEAGTKLKRNFFINDRRLSLVLKGQF